MSSSVAYWMEQLINGFFQGSIYALIAIGYTLIVGIVGLPSFAYGDVVMCGAFFAYLAFGALNSATLVVFILSFIGTAILGVIVHKVCYEHFYNSPRQVSLMCTIGMSFLIKNTVQIITAGTTVAMPEIFGDWGFFIGSIRVRATQIWVLGIVIVLVIAFTLFMKKTKLGVQLRAVSQDRQAASLMGINVNGITMLGNAIGCGMGGIAGLLYAVYYSSFRATMGGSIGMKAFSSATLGGMSSISIASMAGMIIGIFENIGIALTTSTYRDMVAFIFLIVVLIFKPTGLAGGNTKHKKEKTVKGGAKQ